MSILFAIPDTVASADLHWFYSEQNGEVEPVLADELSDLQADRIALIVSGRDVYSGTIDAVTRSEKQLREIALYQLEDDLAEPVAGLHLALGPSLGEVGSARRVNIVSQARMTQWMDALKRAGGKFAERTKIISDTSLFDSAPSGFLFDGDGVVLLKTSDGMCAMDPGTAAELVPALLQSSGDRVESLVIGEDAVLADSLNVSPEARQTLSYVELVSRRIWEETGLDLRQGQYRTAESVDIGFLNKWTGTLALAAGVCLVWLMYQGVSAYQLNRAADGLYQQSVDRYKAVFPDEGVVANPRARVAEKLRNSNIAMSDVPATALMSGFYQALSGTEGVELVSMSFNGGTGLISSSLKFSSYQDRDTFKQAIEKVGMSVELGGVSQEDGILVGQAIIGVGS